MTKHIPFTICWLWQLSAFPAPRLLWCSQLVRCHRRRAPAGTARPCEWHKNPAARCWLLGVEPFFFLPNPPAHVVWALILYATSNILGNPSPSACCAVWHPPPTLLLVYLNRQASRTGSSTFSSLLHSSKVHLTDLQNRSQRRAHRGETWTGTGIRWMLAPLLKTC